MGVDPDVKAFIPTINQTFTFTNQDGEVDNYVETYTMDSQQQYNYARKRMRKDILDLQVTENFKKTTIYYQDIVLAAFEVGYITFEDLETVITYDDLWNPTRTKFQRMVNFIFRVANVGTFFVPPPFNIVGAIALTVVEGVVDNKNANGANNDNAATIID